MIKLLVIGDLAQRGWTVSRLYSLERLTECGYPVTVKVRNRNPPSIDLQWADVIFISRATSLDDLKFIQSAKMLNKKIWVDSDDALLHVPIDHDNYFNLMQEGPRTTYTEIHHVADHVSYSTSALRDCQKLLHFESKTSIIPCAYPDEILADWFEQPVEPTKTIIWRGSPTHAQSLVEYMPEIVKVGDAHPDWRFVFVGYHPWQITNRLKNNWRVEGWIEIDHLFSYLQAQRPAVFMVARTANTFTRCRSSIGHVEGTCAGAVTVAPDWDEWSRPGIMNYYKKAKRFGGEKTNFAKMMHKAMKESTTSKHLERVELARKDILANNAWSVVNKLQYQVLEKLMGGTNAT